VQSALFRPPSNLATARSWVPSDCGIVRRGRQGGLGIMPGHYNAAQSRRQSPAWCATISFGREPWRFAAWLAGGRNGNGAAHGLHPCRANSLGRHRRRNAAIVLQVRMIVGRKEAESALRLGNTPLQETRGPTSRKPAPEAPNSTSDQQLAIFHHTPIDWVIWNELRISFSLIAWIRGAS
jgi:hypothetical protein